MAKQCFARGPLEKLACELSTLPNFSYCYGIVERTIRFDTSLELLTFYCSKDSLFAHCHLLRAILLVRVKNRFVVLCLGLDFYLSRGLGPH